MWNRKKNSRRGSSEVGDDDLYRDYFYDAIGNVTYGAAWTTATMTLLSRIGPYPGERLLDMF
jgi:hypothetical protein